MREPFLTYLLPQPPLLFLKFPIDNGHLLLQPPFFSFITTTSTFVLTDRWVWESDLGSSYKGYTGYREVLGGKDDIGGPNQANLKALAFILWCQKSISE